MSVNIILSTENLYVGARLLDTDDVIVTFNNRGDLGDGTGFWGDRFLEKCNVSAIGICARHPNWFPPDDIAEAIRVIRALIGKKRIITYGTSMGAYGALKFSRALGAVRALAFSPQWTINPEYAGKYTHQYSECYDEKLRGGDPIGPEDLGGHCLVFLDMREYPDWKHLEHITDAAKQAEHCKFEVVIAPFTWHGTVFQLTSAKHNMARRLIDLARNDLEAKGSNFRHLIRESRNTSKHYLETRMYCLAHRSGERVDAGIEALRHCLLKIKTQESRLLRSIIACIDGHSEFGMAEILKEIQNNHLWGISHWAMDRILRVLRRHNLKDAEKMIRECIRDREPDSLDLRINISNALADIGFGDRAALDFFDYLYKHPQKMSEEPQRIRSFFEKINQPELLSIIRSEF